jgi:hypothetical protein
MASSGLCVTGASRSPPSALTVRFPHSFWHQNSLIAGTTKRDVLQWLWKRDRGS